MERPPALVCRSRVKIQNYMRAAPQSGLSWVGVIMGEFLVSRAGLGYLIVYGSQVFNMDLVMTSVLILAAAAVVMYRLVLGAEKLLQHYWGVKA